MGLHPIILAAFQSELEKNAAELTALGRKHIARKNFAIPGREPESGSYPVNDLPHARNALARVSQFGSSAEKATVRAKVYSKYPGLEKRKAERQA